MKRFGRGQAVRKIPGGHEAWRFNRIRDARTLR